MHVSDVFTPGDFPEYTYVERGQGEKERELNLQVNKKSFIVSVSGPSKSGKTVLIERTMQQNSERIDQYVTVNGKLIRSEDDFWDRILDSLHAPSTRQYSQSDSDESGISGGVSASIGPVEGDISGNSTKSESVESTVTYDRSGINEVLRLVGDDRIVIYIDDAHYIPDEHHKGIAENLKMAFEHGINFCLSYIPHRSDDLTKANDDLRTRTQYINLDYWKQGELEQIAELGFEHLQVNTSAVKKKFARESIQSPYLMQSLCYRFCMSNQIHQRQKTPADISLSEEKVKQILRKEANNLDYSTAYEIISGSARGRSDKTFTYIDSTEGDRYMTLLRGIAANPPKFSFDLDALKQRVRRQCVDQHPQSGNITQDIDRVHKWINESDEEDFLFDYLEDQKRLEISDPTLVFYLRWSDDFGYEPELK